MAEEGEEIHNDHYGRQPFQAQWPRSLLQRLVHLLLDDAGKHRWSLVGGLDD